MAFRLIRTIALSLVLTVYFASSAASVRADTSVSTVKLHTIKFYLDPALVPDMAFAKAVLPKYVADMNLVLAKNTDRQLAFDPQTGIILTATKPQSDSDSPPLPTEGFEIWANAIHTAYPMSYGGYAGVDDSGAGVLAGLYWTRLYDPDNLAAGDVKDYTIQLGNLLHEFAHVFGAGIGEYYSLGYVLDNTASDPLLNINANNAGDPYWSDKPDFMADPLLRLLPATSRADYLAGVEYSRLTAAIISGDYRNGITSFNSFTVQVLDQDGQPAPDAEIKVWSILAGSPYTSQLMFDGAADANGQVTLPWGGSYSPHNAANLLRLIKVYKDGAPFTPARYISAFDLDIAQLVDGQTSFTVTLQHVNPPPAVSFTSIAANDGWVLESGKAANMGGTLNSTAATFKLGDDAANRQFRSILSFYTPLPAGALVTQLTLSIRQAAGPVGKNPFLNLGNIAVDVKNGSFGRPGMQLVDFSARATTKAAFSIWNDPVDGWYSGTLAGPLADTLVNKAGNTQFRLRFTKPDNNNNLANYLMFYSGNSADAPQLVITYTLP